ncbi:OmpA family protein [Aequorivita sp. SDUM287046]|uniref:OmpA family protein n=1 Tax=Aequorivita aurantiaca TaxID=3053356 RepID=A0ABT8DI59_9FLAO|nr:OmpA family protein [Aequorivita aurantiaca]MDN3725085.1 OmpA family protein [Aequorivita aurantiaca]
MKIKYYLRLIFVLLLSLAPINKGTSQNPQLTKANEKYENYGYIDALKIYEKVAEKGYGSEEIYIKLGNSYYFNAQYDQAAKWYEKLFTINPEPNNSALLLRYSQALNAIGSNEKARTLYNQYLKLNPVNSTIDTAIDYMQLIKENSDRYKFQKMASIFDPNNIAFGNTKLNGKLIFASTHDSKGLFNRKSAWDGLNFLSIFEIEVDNENNAVGQPTKLSNNFKGKYHESSLIYTKDQNTIYYTSNNNLKPKDGENQNLKIYRLVKKDGKWSEPQELLLNSDHFSNAHPSLSPDEKTLYFASDRPGGAGETDIYKAAINEDGSLGTPINLGTKINTSGKDTFPFVSVDNELYFSSNGHFGLGGLDVFYIDLNPEDYGDLLNVGEPINSYADDFAFGIDNKNRRGFVSSTRAEAVGHFVHSNIYNFLELKPIQNLYLGTIHGKATDVKTGQAIAGATITITDEERNPIINAVTDAEGNYSVKVNKTKRYYVKASHDNYDTDEKQSQLNLEEQEINFQLQPNKVAITGGTDLAKVLNIPLIYFDYNKWNIRPDAEVELEKIFITLNEYPDLKLNIRAHSDSRGSVHYNQQLSARRATATKEYLFAQGIEPGRLSSEGLGESELLNECSDDVPCSEEKHQLNRRSEFIVIN